MDRSHGKFRHPHRRDGRPTGRRPPPPPSTGLEAEFLSQKQRAKVPLVVTLTDGMTVCGTIQGFDRDQITIEDSSGPMVIRKSEIRYLQEDE